MQEIQLTKGYVALVDDDDFPRLSQRKWYANEADGRVYAYREFRIDGRRIKVAMHREIMEAMPCEEIDHAIGIGLDNRRHNIRRANRSQQRANQGARKDSKHGRKGIKPHHGKWLVKIAFQGRTTYHGSYDDIEVAAAKYLEVAREVHGEFARN